MNAVTKVKEPETAVVDYGSSLLEVIAKAARDPNVDIDKMERLLQMQERVQSRNAEIAYSEAFSEMQPHLPAINRNAQIVHKGTVISEYAEWADISKAISPILSSYGFSLSFKPSVVEGKTAVTAILRHKSGFKDEATLPLPTDTSGAKNAVQAVGSTLTYAKRYAAVLILNIRVDSEDDDGVATGPKIQHEAPRDMPFPQGPARNKSDLKTKGREAWREVEAVSSLSDLEDKLDKHASLFEQLRQALPSWWTGGERDGNSFEGLEAVIARIQIDFNAVNEYNQGG